MRKNELGFTIIEAIVVMVIVTMLAGVAVISVNKALPSRNLKRAAGDMFSTMRKARVLAIKRNSPVTMVFYVNKGQYSIDGKSALDDVKLPDGASQSTNLSQYYGYGIKFGYPGVSDAVTFNGDILTFNTVGLTGESGKYVFIQNEKGGGNEGYRIGIRGMSNLVMEKCGAAGVVCAN